MADNDSQRGLLAIRKSYTAKQEHLLEILVEGLSKLLLNEKIPLDIVNAETKELIAPANRKITKSLLKKVAEAYKVLEIDPSPIRDSIRQIIKEFESRYSGGLTAIEKERWNAFEKTDYFTFFREFTQRAERGEADAQYALGLFYLEDHPELPKNTTFAQALLRKAAEQGSLKAQIQLGDLLAPQDEAEKWYLMAAKQKSTESFVKLGDFYLLGSKKNDSRISKAAGWFKKAADQNNPYAQCRLASLCYRNPDSTIPVAFPHLSGYERFRARYAAQDSLLRLFYSAATQGNTDAQMELVSFWETGRQKVFSDYHIRLGNYAASAEPGEDDMGESSSSDDKEGLSDAEHDFHNGFCHFCGRSRRLVRRLDLRCDALQLDETEKDDAEQLLSQIEDQIEAQRWRRRAALQLGEKGYVEAENLGDLCAELGDKRAAKKWYRTARLPFSSSQIRALAK